MPRKISQEEFIERAIKIHKNEYDYSLVNYVNSNTKIKIICPEHGIFEQLPPGHLRGKKCLKCSGNDISSSIDFINKAKILHKSKYDYSLVEYKNAKTKVKISCPEHGIFLQMPNTHLNGKGCMKCSGKELKTKEQYIKEVTKIHNNKYDYSLIEYKGNKHKIKIICPEHGKFNQQAGAHIHKIQGCPKCANIISKGEKEVLEYVRSIYSGFIIENTRQIIKPYELDIYLPSINIALEYNGTYWHKLHEERIPGYHKLKNKLCKDKGIKLINISDVDWKEKTKNIKKLILKCLKN